MTVDAGGGDDASSSDENDAPPAGRRRSAPAALAQPVDGQRDRTETQLLTYDHGDALAKEYDRKSSAAVGSSSSSAVAGGSSGASSSLGAGIWDEDLLAEQICALTSEVCPHECCRARAGVEFASSEPRGLGGSLVFQCRSCGGPRELQRSRRVGPRSGAKGARGGGVYAALRFVVRRRRHGASRRECDFNWAKSTAPQRAHLGWRGREDSRSIDGRV
jgi:hypothetical protein